jgi:hypothetical protein
VTSRAVEVSHLYSFLTEVADKHVDEDRHNVVQETGPVVELESCHKSSHQHEQDVAWSQNRTNEQDNLRREMGECLFYKKNYIVTRNIESNFFQKKSLR